MRRWSLRWALAVCAITAVGCGSSKAPTPGAAKGVKGQYYYLAVAPPTGGTIASGDGTIACQSSGTGCGDSVFHQTKFTWGAQVTLTATAAQGYQFQSWSGDCSGTTCTVGTTEATEYSVAAVFAPVTPPPSKTLARVYGYVKDGSTGAAGVKLTLGSLSATTNANGAYVFEVAPGAYTLTTVASSQYAALAPVAVTVPATDGIADPAGSCFKAGAKQGFWVPTAGQTAAGCLVRQADLALTRASSYVAPAAPPVPVKTLAFGGIAGFGQTASLDCGDATGTWTQVSGPTTVAPGGGSTFSFTTPDLATAFAALDPVKLAIVKDGRPSFLSINQAQATALTYTFKCTTAAGGVATATVPLVAAVNANIATALRGEPFVMASYKGAANGLPGVTGPLWAAGAETTNGGAGNPDGSTWRAHDAVQVPPGVILILDGPATANWKLCGAAKDSYTSCSAIPSTVLNVPTITNDGNGNAWFPVTWTVGKSVYLTSDALSATNNTFVGEPNIPVATKVWGGWDLTSTPGGQNPLNADGSINPAGPVATVESCGLCHVSPGLFAGVVNGQNTFELGPTEPVIGWKESKHARAGIDGGSSTHFTLQSCGGCHTVGYDPNLPASNVGFSAVLGSYTNDFLFEGSDATIWEADLAAKNQPAALLNNVQCGNCHGPTPNSPNHTASLSSKICGTCHNGHDPQYEQWASTAAFDPTLTPPGPKHGHANLADAQGEGPNRGRDQTHCGRCHFAQGYFLYSQAIVSGNPDKLGNAAPVGAPSTARVTPLLCSDAAAKSSDSCPTTQTTGLVTAQNIDAITCQTCHDPHSLEVRIKDTDTATGMLLAGGFKIYSAGSGAVCASCHNSRNGIVGATAPNLNSAITSVGGTPMQHNDATPLTSNTTNNFGMTGPHLAAQADVYFAGNGYLLCNSGSASGACPMPTTANPHQDPAYFKDTCAECHVKQLSMATAGAPSNHTFTVDEGTCANCHGKGTTYIASRQLIVNRMIGYTDQSGTFHPGEYQTSLANVLNGAGIASVTGKLNGASSAAAYAVTSSIAKVVVSGDRPLTLDFTFSNGDTVTGCSIDTIYAAGSAPVLYTVSGTDKVYGKVAKSMYDYALIKNDNSAGVHNIPFVDAMMDAMVNNLDSPGSAVK